MRSRQDELDDVREESESLAMSLALDECSDDRPPVAAARPDDTASAGLPGARLREHREQRGLTIDDLARTTKISKAILHALESTDVLHLPAAIYTRGFVKAYAREIGLAPDPTADDYLRAIEPLRAQQSFGNVGTLPALTTATPQSEATDDARRLRAESQMRRLGWVLTFAAAVGLVIYVAASNRAARQVSDASAVARDAASDAEYASRADVATRADHPAAADSIASAALTEPALRVELVTHAQCWVSARVDGEPVLAKLLQPGERHTLDVSDEAVLRVGEPGALSFSINGQTGRRLGRAGQPVTVRITKDNFREFLSS